MHDTNHARHVLDLAAVRNNAGCALPGFDTPGGFDGFGRAYPAEDLRRLGDLVGGWPEGFGRGAHDNVECDGQYIGFTRPVLLSSLVLLGAACGGRTADELSLFDADTTSETEVGFGFPDFLSRTDHNCDVPAVTCSTLRDHGRDIDAPPPSIWRTEIRLAHPVTCSGLRLPINPGLHMFGIRALAENRV